MLDVGCHSHASGTSLYFCKVCKVTKRPIRPLIDASSLKTSYVVPVGTSSRVQNGKLSREFRFLWCNCTFRMRLHVVCMFVLEH